MADDRANAIQLAGRLTATRASFSAAFTLAQERARRTETIDFKVVGTDLDDHAAFAQGILHARTAGWYNFLGAVFVEQGFLSLDVEDRAPRRRARSRPAGGVDAMLDLDSGFATGEQELPGLYQLYRQTCLVSISGAAKGTGVLVASNVVLTAWHVVREEIDSTNPAAPSSRPGSEGRISIAFEEIPLRGGAAPAPLICPVAAQWLIACSPCHPDEIDLKLPVPTALVGLNDFALIRLDDVPGIDRGYLDLASAADASVTKRVHIFQHPLGWKIRHSAGKVTKMYSTNRFIHGAETLPGSSGGPCVDPSFRFVGLHQAGPRQDEKVKAALFRRGIPVTAFLAEVQPRLTPEASPMLWRIEDPVTPVVGRDDFQTAVLAATATPQGTAVPPQLIAVIGGTQTEQRLCRRLLDRLLPPVSDKFVPIAAGSLPDRPEPLIREIARALGDPNADQLTFAPETDSGTTRPAWIRNQLVPAFESAIGRFGTNRRLWLVIDDLELHNIPAGALPEFLAAVYERLPQLPWLRVVLIGFSGGVPPKALPIYRPIRLIDPTEDQLATYLERRFAKELSVEECKATATALWAEATRLVAEDKLPLVDALRATIAELDAANLAAGHP